VNWNEELFSLLKITAFTISAATFFRGLNEDGWGVVLIVMPCYKSKG
jgi:hypothetical protein